MKTEIVWGRDADEAVRKVLGLTLTAALGIGQDGRFSLNGVEAGTIKQDCPHAHPAGYNVEHRYVVAVFVDASASLPELIEAAKELLPLAETMAALLNADGYPAYYTMGKPIFDRLRALLDKIEGV
jgi:hypothetical protein